MLSRSNANLCEESSVADCGEMCDRAVEELKIKGRWDALRRYAKENLRAVEWKGLTLADAQDRGQLAREYQQRAGVSSRDVDTLLVIQRVVSELGLYKEDSSNGAT